MFAIDLLKGEGVPMRSRPGGILFACTVIAVPLIIGIAMVGIGMEHQVALSIQEEQLAKIQGVIGTLSEALTQKHAMEARKTAATGLLSDIKTALTHRTTWTPVLVTLAQAMPEELVLTKLEAQQEPVRRQAPAQNDPAILVDVTIPMRTLAISVCGQDGNASYKAVQSLQNHLRSAQALGPRLDSVTVSQGSTTFEGKEVASYELNCVFKPALE